MTSRACGNPAIETFLYTGIFLSKFRGKTESLFSIIFPNLDNVTTNLKNTTPNFLALSHPEINVS